MIEMKTSVVCLLFVYMIVFKQSGEGVIQKSGDDTCTVLCERLEGCQSSFIQNYLLCGDEYTTGTVVRKQNCKLSGKYSAIILSRTDVPVEGQEIIMVPGTLKTFKFRNKKDIWIYVKFYKERKTWREALRFCRSKGGTLLTLHDRLRVDVFRRMHEMADSVAHSNPWIGLRRRSKNHTWTWTDGKSVSKMKWSSPWHTPTHNCALGIHLFSVVRYLDIDCNSKQAFICESTVV